MLLFLNLISSMPISPCNSSGVTFLRDNSFIFVIIGSNCARVSTLSTRFVKWYRNHSSNILYCFIKSWNALCSWSVLDSHGGDSNVGFVQLPSQNLYL